ncbi:MAG TPA: hypothetical protein VFD02_04215 [Syntrophomonadaceae bacterium]|nr:hypothetical protein [Syntrophomonadaceae bacterium]
MIILRNSGIFLSLLLLSIPYNYFVNYYAMFLSLLQYVPVIIFAFLSGVALIFMDLSDRRINFIFALLFLLIAVLELGGFMDIFLYGPTGYFYILLFGALLATAIKKPSFLTKP